MAAMGMANGIAIWNQKNKPFSLKQDETNCPLSLSPTISHSSPQDRKHCGTWVLAKRSDFTIGRGIMEKLVSFASTYEKGLDCFGGGLCERY